jgi:hypothetical protein
MQEADRLLPRTAEEIRHRGVRPTHKPNDLEVKIRKKLAHTKNAL